MTKLASDESADSLVYFDTKYPRMLSIIIIIQLLRVTTTHMYVF